MEYKTLYSHSADDSPAVIREFLIPVWLNFIIALIGLAGNIVVLCFLGHRTLRNAISVYIVNLAVADFLFLCHFIILYMGLFSGKINPIHYVYLLVVRSFSYITGLSMISAMSLECCLSLLFPTWYRCRRSRRTSVVTTSMLWVVTLLIIILAYSLCAFLFYVTDNICLIMHYVTAAWLIFLIVVLSGSSLALLIGILSGSWRSLLTRSHVTVGLKVLVFLPCGLPFGILSIMPNSSAISNSLSSVAIFLSIINSSVSLIIYYSVGSFREKKSLKLALQKALEDVTEE